MRAPKIRKPPTIPPTMPPIVPPEIRPDALELEGPGVVVFEEATSVLDAVDPV